MTKPTLQVLEGGENSNDILQFVEVRPSSIHGLDTFYLCLTYKEHRFEEMLPFDFQTWDDASQAIMLAPIAKRLKDRMKVVLDAEDAQA